MNLIDKFAMTDAVCLIISFFGFVICQDGHGSHLAELFWKRALQTTAVMAFAFMIYYIFK